MPIALSKAESEGDDDLMELDCESKKFRHVLELDDETAECLDYLEYVMDHSNVPLRNEDICLL